MIYFFLFSMTQGMGPPESESRILLIVDDYLAVGKMIKRSLGRKHFDYVYVAETTAEASEILQKHRVTHIVCDQEVGRSEMTGDRFVSFWRKRCPHIQKVVMFTGADVQSIERFPEIDAVVGKTRPRSELLQALGVSDEELVR